MDDIVVKKDTTTTTTTTTTDQLEQPKSGWMWIKNSNGMPSATLTFVTIAFWVTALAYVASIVTKIGPLEFRAFDAMAGVAFLTPLLATYLGRRFVDAKYLEK